MTKLQKILWTGTGEELDNLGKLLDLPRRFYGPDRADPDAIYRHLLAEHPMMRLLALATEEAR